MRNRLPASLAPKEFYLNLSSLNQQLNAMMRMRMGAVGNGRNLRHRIKTWFWIILNSWKNIRPLRKWNRGLNDSHFQFLFLGFGVTSTKVQPKARIMDSRMPVGVPPRLENPISPGLMSVWKSSGFFTTPFSRLLAAAVFISRA